MHLKTINWLASYPKSGNTWVRAFLRAYQLDAYEPVDVNGISKISRTESRLRYYQMVSGHNGQFSDELVDRYRLPVQALIAEEIGEHQVVKTHNARIERNGLPMIGDQFTRGAIYLVRNPLDVVDSLADHNGSTIDQAVSLMNDPGHIIGGPNQELVTQYLTTWSNHVMSWLTASAFPVLVIRYEELVESPETFFGQVLRFLGWYYDEERLQRAVRHSSFKSLKTSEQEAGFSELSHSSASKTFFRRGGSGEWSKLLDKQHVEAICDHHYQVMLQLGYL